MHILDSVLFYRCGASLDSTSASKRRWRAEQRRRRQHNACGGCVCVCSPLSRDTLTTRTTQWFKQQECERHKHGVEHVFASRGKVYTLKQSLSPRVMPGAYALARKMHAVQRAAPRLAYVRDWDCDGVCEDARSVARSLRGWIKMSRRAFERNRGSCLVLAGPQPALAQISRMKKICACAPAYVFFSCRSFSSFCGGKIARDKRLRVPG